MEIGIDIENGEKKKSREWKNQKSSSQLNKQESRVTVVHPNDAVHTNSTDKKQYKHKKHNTMCNGKLRKSLKYVTSVLLDVKY